MDVTKYDHIKIDLKNDYVVFLYSMTFLLKAICVYIYDNNFIMPNGLTKDEQ